MSDLESRAAAGAAVELPSDVGEVFVQHSILDRGMAALGNGQHWHQASGGVEECHLAASRGAQLEDHTCSQPLQTVDVWLPGCCDVGKQHYDCPSPEFLLGFQVAPSFLCEQFLLDCRQHCYCIQ